MTQTHTIRTGDLVTSQLKVFPLIEHPGLAVVEGDEAYIWHCTPARRNTVGGNVVKERLSNWLRTRTITGIRPTGLTAPQVEWESRKLARKRWNIVGFNCFDFVNRVTAISHQTELA